MRRLNDLWIYAATIVVVALVFGCSCSGRGADAAYKVYPVLENDRGSHALPMIEFAVNRALSEVVGLVHYRGELYIWRLKNCDIFDRLNWTCSEPGGKSFAIRQGEYRGFSEIPDWDKPFLPLPESANSRIQFRYWMVWKFLRLFHD